MAAAIERLGPAVSTSKHGRGESRRILNASDAREGSSRKHWRIVSSKMYRASLARRIQRLTLVLSSTGRVDLSPPNRPDVRIGRPTARGRVADVSTFAFD